MKISLPHSYLVFTGIMATALSLVCGFSTAASAASILPQTMESSGTEAPTPETPQPPRPKPPE